MDSASDFDADQVYTTSVRDDEEESASNAFPVSVEDDERKRQILTFSTRDMMDGEGYGLMYPKVLYAGIDVVDVVTTPPTYPPIISFAATFYNESKKKKRSFFYSRVADFLWPYLFIVPLAFTVLIAVGWSTNGEIQQEVAGLWVPQDGKYYADQKYAARWGSDKLSYSSYSALAISRDGTNIMTADRLDEIRRRMEATEATTVGLQQVVGVDSLFYC
jgi:hypothetical protein